MFYDAALAAAGGEVASARRIGVRIREILTTSRSRPIVIVFSRSQPIVIVFSRPQPIVDVSALDVVNGQGASTPHVGAAIPVNCRGVSAMAVDGGNTTSPEVDLLSCYRHSGDDGGDGRQTENQFAHAISCNLSATANSQGPGPAERRARVIQSCTEYRFLHLSHKTISRRSWGGASPFSVVQSCPRGLQDRFRWRMLDPSSCPSTNPGRQSAGLNCQFRILRHLRGTGPPEWAGTTLACRTTECSFVRAATQHRILLRHNAFGRRFGLTYGEQDVCNV